MSEVISEYAKNKTTTIIVLVTVVMIAGMVAHIPLTALGVVLVTVGVIGIASSWAIDSGLIKKEYTTAFILLVAGAAITIVGLMLRGYIPVFAVSGDFIADVVFSFLIYTAVIAVAIGLVYAIVTMTPLGDKLRSRIKVKHDIVGEYRSKYIE